MPDTQAETPQTDFVLPSDTAEFLKESEAETAEAPVTTEDETSAIAEDIADRAAPQRPPPPRQNKGAPPPQVGKAPRQPPPDERKIPLPDWARVIDANGKRVEVDTLEQLVSMARRGHALQQKAPEISALQQHLLKQQQMLNENPDAFLAQRDKGWRKEWAQRELLEDALEDLVLRSENPAERIAAKEKLLELREQKATQVKQMEQQQREQSELQQLTQEEAAKIDAQYSDAIEKLGYPKNRLAIKIMAVTHQQHLADPSMPDPDIRTLAADSVAQIWEAIGEHFDSYKAGGDILDAIPKRFHEDIRKAFLARAKAPERKVMSPAVSGKKKAPIPRDWTKADQDDKDDFEREIAHYKKLAVQEAFGKR